ncbi:MAG TPA: AzlD domain-containing protein [Firmicutes bacterium]|uniref:AzlD domain-containing protein n=1 Tax=Capillibacterium thermochitinicola TaxID=2699427 RepID=A0A8J6LLP9_9FIRM|nr:AzlD domain-containing protein [Capillibacterium thermochitinicola]MBA2132348.1 AzlD domain-containing protein [Capillibacterium thermochitinicola]HHW12591.1 AzlD domain-containing protein [Bacillota bacterium]
MGRTLLAVFLMALVSYLPRVTPLVFLRQKIKSPFIQSFLYYVPYAVLGAMTFPAILSATGDTTSALAGFGVALLLAFYEKSLMTVALCASLAVYLCQLFLG